MNYLENLNATKANYPFDRWRTYYPNESNNFEGMEQYTSENCDKAQAIFDTLIDKLGELGENGTKSDKEKMFAIAIIALNDLNDETDGALIETGEREDLCELIDEITIKAGLNPEDYAVGDGMADEWRDW